MKLVVEVSGQKSSAVQYYLDSLDICQCSECEVFLGMDDLVIPEGEDGFMCRPCLEASGAKEFWI